MRLNLGLQEGNVRYFISLGSESYFYMLLYLVLQLDMRTNVFGFVLQTDTTHLPNLVKNEISHCTFN